MDLTWNAHVEVENVDVAKKTVGLGWAVSDDKAGGANAYGTDITVTLPQDADASVVKKAPNETVVLKRSASLSCGPNGIEANVTYHVSPRTGTGHQVSVKVATHSGHKPPATGDILATGSGQVGQDITIHVVIPGSCA